MKSIKHLLLILLFMVALSPVKAGEDEQNFRQYAGSIERLKRPCSLLQGISERELSVYLPESYDRAVDKVYPVLYLLHGGGDSHTYWESRGRLRQVADSLSDSGIADKQSRNYWIGYGDKQIFGVLDRPSRRGGKKPLAIIAHGFNGSHAFGEVYAKELNEAGWLCYRFDCCGGSVHTRSTGNTMQMSLTSECDDLKAVIDHFRRHPEVDVNRIVLIGESQGGIVSALTAADRAKDISQLVLVYPAFCIPDNWLERYPTTESVPDTVRIWNVPLSKDFVEDLRGMNVYKTIKQYRNPVLLIHGTADPVVPISYSERAVKTFRKAELRILPGAGHGFKPEEQRKAIGYIKEFLKIRSLE